MAVSFLNQEISNLCLGKQPLRSLPVTATVGDAVSHLKRSGEIHVSVWSCDHCSSTNNDCRCVGKVCMVDVICFLCREENRMRPSDALQSPLSVILSNPSSIVRHLESNSSLLEAIDYILEGAQNLVIPIENCKSNRKRVLTKQSSLTIHNEQEFCWLTQEDILRFFLNSICIYSPVPTHTIKSLNIIDKDAMTVHYHDSAFSALANIHRAHEKQTSIAVIDDDNRLVGEISPSALASCDETVAAAISTLSTGDLMAYIHCGGPPEDLVQLVKMRLEEKNLGAMLELMEEYAPISASSSSSSSCSSDEEFGSSRHVASRRHSLARRSEAIVCHPWNSFVAVMIQALAHRTSCVWVVEEDFTLVGVVTFVGMLKVFRSFAGAQNKSGENRFK